MSKIDFAYYSQVEVMFDIKTGKRIWYTAVTFLGSYLAGRITEITLEDPVKHTPLNWVLVFSTVGVNLMFIWNLWYHAMKNQKSFQSFRKANKAFRSLP